MQWGLLIDTDPGAQGGNFSALATAYDPISGAFNEQMTIQGVTTNHVFMTASTVAGDGIDDFTMDNNFAGPPVSAFHNGIGGLISRTSLDYITVGTADTLAESQPFALMWIDLAGRDYGLVTTPSFNLPSDSSATFSFVDDTRTTSQADRITNLEFAPEPSAALLGLLALTCALLGRRNR